MMMLPDSLFNRRALQEYVLIAGQHPAGGLRDKPPKQARISFFIYLGSRFTQECGRLPYCLLYIRPVGRTAPCVPFTCAAGRGACGVEGRRWRPRYSFCRGSLLDGGG